MTTRLKTATRCKLVVYRPSDNLRRIHAVLANLFCCLEIQAVLILCRWPPIRSIRFPYQITSLAMSQQINPNAGMHVGMMPANAPGVHPGGLPQMPPMAGGGPGLAPNMVPIGNPNAQMNIPPPQGQGSHSGGHSGGGGGGGSHASQQDNLIYKVRLLIAQLKKSLGVSYRL